MSSDTETTPKEAVYNERESSKDSPERFKEPKLAINRVYTRSGDQGLTRLVGGQKISKADL